MRNRMALVEVARGLVRTRGFALIGALTLGVGIGAASAIFTLVNSILVRPLPYANADRLVVVEHDAPGLGVGRVANSDAMFLHCRRGNRV